MLKRLFTAILASALLLGSLMAFNVSAAETNETKQARIGFSTYDMELYSYLRYYYDTSTPNHITKAYAYSAYFGENSTPYTSKNVYMINEVKAKSSTRVTYTKKAISGNFYMNQAEHIDEYTMSSSMLAFSSSVTVASLQSTCYMSTFNGAVSHAYPDNCPLSSETILFEVSAYK